MRSVDRLSVLYMPIDRQSSSYSMSLSLCMAYPESEVGKSLGQAGQRLEPRACLCNQRKRRRRPRKVSAGVLDALCLAGLVLEGARSWACEAAALGRADGVGCTLRAPAGGRSGEHRGMGAGRRALDVVGGGNGWKAYGGEVSRCLTSTKFRAPSLCKCLRSTLHWPGHPPHPLFLQVRSPVPSIARQALTFSNFTSMSHR
jgi:hypothetical protein